VHQLQSLGGELVTQTPVDDLRDLPPSQVVLLDLTPRQVLGLRGTKLPPRYVAQLQRYRYGPGVCKLDWILEGPVPWRNADCARAGTVHVGGSLEEIAAAEAAPWRGVHAEKPFVLLAQPSLFDPTRAPAGKHILWGYCHVPHASEVDMTSTVEAQIERFAPGFRERILARHVRSARDMERINPNLVGGDIGGGVLDWRQLFTRPTNRLDPYGTPVKNLFLCSSATPPGGGVHGLCGAFAAHSALRRFP
jgi:phytoene dehydrogenase-like protein